jgi:hypothetical protein
MKKLKRIPYCWIAIVFLTLSDRVTFAEPKHPYEKELPENCDESPSTSPRTIQRQIEDLRSPLQGNGSRYLYTGYKKKKIDPAPVVFNKESKGCREWVEAHKLCGVEEFLSAQFLLDQLDYVSYDQFQAEMDSSIHSFLEQIADRKFVVIVDPDKSSEWLLAQFENRLSIKDHDVVLRSDLLSYLKENNKIQDVLILDDAIYSGEQMERYANYVSAPASSVRPIQFHAVVPYATRQGKERLKSSSAGRSDFSVSLYNTQTMNTIKEKARNENITKTLRQMYPENPKAELGDLSSLKDTKTYSPATRTHQFFQFKIPDGFSVITQFLVDNEVRCKDGRSPAKKLEGRCIPEILPPYKIALSPSENTKRRPPSPVERAKNPHTKRTSKRSPSLERRSSLSPGKPRNRSSSLGHRQKGATLIKPSDLESIKE